MSPDQKFVRKMIALLDAAGLEAILVGNGGAQMHSAPVYTLDLDFLVRDTPLNRKKIEKVARQCGPAVSVKPISDMTDALRLQGLDPPVDFLFALGGGLRFESVRARAGRLSPDSGRVWLASLEDIIAAKEAANRPKDLGSLVQLRETLEATARLKIEMRKDEPPKAAERRSKYRLAPKRRVRVAARR